MKQLFKIKVKNFLVQLLCTPISFLINALALAPLVYLFGGESVGEPLNLIFILPICWALAFVGNEFFLRLKGKKTEEYIDITYIRREVEISEGVNTIYVDITDYEEEGVERELTFWGILARILCFVAFPLRLVSLIMAYAALFCPIVFVSHKRINPNMNYGVGNKLLHTLFDFVILPIHGERSGRKSPKGLIWILVYAVSWVVAHVLLLMLISTTLRYINGVIEIPLFFIVCFCMLSSLILTIKYCVTISFDYSRKIATMRLLKTLAFPLVLAALFGVLAILPF